MNDLDWFLMLNSVYLELTQDEIVHLIKIVHWF